MLFCYSIQWSSRLIVWTVRTLLIQRYRPARKDIQMTQILKTKHLFQVTITILLFYFLFKTHDLGDWIFYLLSGGRKDRTILSLALYPLGPPGDGNKIQSPKCRVLNKRPKGWIMFRTVIVTLIYHCHKPTDINLLGSKRICNVFPVRYGQTYRAELSLRWTMCRIMIVILIYRRHKPINSNNLLGS
jgi:hypothetical protein